MGHVVDFPGKKHPAQTDLVAERINNHSHSINSRLDFTCVVCQNQTHFEINNAVFKNLELFCTKCGSGWRVSNPVFATGKASDASTRTKPQKSQL